MHNLENTYKLYCDEDGMDMVNDANTSILTKSTYYCLHSIMVAFFLLDFCDWICIEEPTICQGPIHNDDIIHDPSLSHLLLDIPPCITTMLSLVIKTKGEHTIKQPWTWLDLLENKSFLRVQGNKRCCMEWPIICHGNKAMQIMTKMV